VAEDGEMIAGVNQNYGDTVEFSNITVGDGITICGRWEGNDTGAEPSFVDDGADGEHCLYDSDDIHEL
jgi:pectate lyase